MEFEARRIRRNKIIWVIVFTVIMPIAAYIIGVNWMQSLLVAAGTATIGILIAVLPLGEDITWEKRNDATADGARREVSRLSWTLGGHDNRVGDAPARRLRILAARRLARRGIDLRTQEGMAAAIDLLGKGVMAVLTTEVGPPPRYDDFVRCVTAIERLETAPAADPHTSSTRTSITRTSATSTPTHTGVSS